MLWIVLVMFCFGFCCCAINFKRKIVLGIFIVLMQFQVLFFFSTVFSHLKQWLSFYCIRYSLLFSFGIKFQDFIWTDFITFLQLDDDSVSTKSPSNQKSGFLPVFRSGSCAERGPKQYMEDEHVCIDNLIDHFGETDDFSSPGAFYGVSVPFLPYHFNCSLVRRHFNALLKAG